MKPDARWLWDAASAIRSEARYKGQISEAEAVLNISIESDVLPWMGRTYVAFLPGATPTAPPTYVVVAEIRDNTEYATDVARMKANLAERPHVTVTAPVKVDGADVIHVKGPSATGPMLTIAARGGWVIASTDGYAVRKLLDTAVGKAHNIGMKTTFADALTTAESTQGSICGVVDNDPVTGPFKSLFAGGSASVKSPAKLSHTITAFTVVDKETSLRIDTTNYVLDQATRSLMDRLRAAVTPITGESLAHVPDESVASFLFSSPNKYLSFEKELLDKVDTSKAGVTFDPFTMLTPYYNLLANFTGEVNTSVVWHNGQFGVFISCQTSNPDAAQSSLTNFTNLFAKMQPAPQQSGGIYTLSVPSPLPMMPLSPSFRTNDEYFQFSTAKQWFDLSEGAPELSFPNEATGSTAVGLGSFRFLDQVLPMLAKIKPGDHDLADFISGLEAMHIADGTWATWSKMEVGGDVSTSSFVLDSVDWKSLAKLATDLAGGEAAKAPGRPYHSPTSKARKRAQ